MKLKALMTGLMLFASQVAYPCGPSDMLKVYSGKGAARVEEIKLVLEPADNDPKKAFKIFDDDGIANIFFLTPVTKGLSDDKIVTLQATFVSSLNKAIEYKEKSIQRTEQRLAGNSLDQLARLQAASKIEKDKQAVEKMKDLATAIVQRGLTRADFGTFMNQIFKPIASTVGYEYSVYENGQFTKRPSARTLLDILGEQTYNSIAFVTADGEYLTTRGGCGVSGQLVDQVQAGDGTSGVGGTR